MPSSLKRIDHVTCVVRPDTIRRWAWFYIEVLGGVLTLRTDDTNPSGASSMMVWTIDFAEFGVALIAGIDREEKSHVTAFAEKHGDHSFQHVAFQVSELNALCAHLGAHGVNLLGDTLVRKDERGGTIQQVFGNPFHDHENSSVVGFYEFVERPEPPEAAEVGTTPEISFSESTGTLLYEQAQSAMVEDRERRVPMTRFSKMPPGWEIPEPRPDRVRDGEMTRRRGRREQDGNLIGEIHRWKSYRQANDRFPLARTAELDEMSRRARVRPGETVAELGTGTGLLTFRLARAVGARGRVFTYDVSADNLVSVMLANGAGLPIVPVRWSPADEPSTFPLGDEVDCVATLATFHHLDNRSVRPGRRGREAAAAALHRLLKRGGRLVIGDVAAGSTPARYFDAIDDPRYCYPAGHPHDFLTGPEMKELLRAAGFVEIECVVRSVPWVFASKGEAVEFLSTMHNAKCPAEEVLALAEQTLRLDEEPGRCTIQWELLFVAARKP